MPDRTPSRGVFRTFLLGLGAACAGCSVGESAAETAVAPPPRLPNVVVFFVDDLGYADVEPFGAPAGATPALARLAREGIVHRNFHVAQPVCSASRAALLTGCYPNRLGVHGALMPWDKTGLAPEETTLAEVLRGRGYATALYGKWHLGHCDPAFLPTRQGFDEYFGIPYSNDMWIHRAGTSFPPLPLYDGETVVDDDVDAADQATLTDRLAARAERFVAERAAAGPFYVQLNFSMVHVPLYAGAAFAGRTGRGLYADVVAEVDAAVGRVLAALDRAGVAEDTFVLFTSDNGPWLPYGEHAGKTGGFREGKGTVFEGGVRVPCLVRYPRLGARGAESEAMLMTIDLLPTLAGLVGAPLPPRPIDGVARPEAFLRGTTADAPPGYAYYYGRGRLQAVVDGVGRFKLVFPHQYVTLAGKPGGAGGARTGEILGRVERPELYDLATDPAESRDVAAAHPEIVARLTAYAEAVRARLGDAATERVGTETRPAGAAAEVPARFRAR